MMYYSIWLAPWWCCGVACMVLVVTQKDRRRFRQIFCAASSKRWASTEGFMEEMMNGQKVVKVFCHEAGRPSATLTRINDELFSTTPERPTAMPTC